jgi:hypothetical protein
MADGTGYEEFGSINKTKVPPFMRQKPGKINGPVDHNNMEQVKRTLVSTQDIPKTNLKGFENFLAKYSPNSDLEIYLAGEAEIKAQKENRVNSVLSKYAKSIANKNISDLTPLERLKYDVAKDIVDSAQDETLKQGAFNKMVREQEAPLVANLQKYIMQSAVDQMGNGVETSTLDNLSTDKTSFAKTMREIDLLNPDILDSLQNDPKALSNFIYNAHAIVNDGKTGTGKRSQLRNLLNQSCGYPEFDIVALEQRIKELNRYAVLANMDSRLDDADRVISHVQSIALDKADDREVPEKTAKISFDQSKRIATAIAMELPQLAEKIMTAQAKHLSYDPEKNDVEVTELHDMVKEVSDFIEAKPRTPEDIQRHIRAIQSDYGLEVKKPKPQSLNIEPAVVQEEPVNVIRALKEPIDRTNTEEYAQSRIITETGLKKGVNIPVVGPVNEGVPKVKTVLAGQTRYFTKPKTPGLLSRLKQNVSQKPLAWAAGFVAVAALAVAAYMAPSQSNNNVDVAAQAGADAPAVRESSLNLFEGILSGDLLAPRAEPIPNEASTASAQPVDLAIESAKSPFEPTAEPAVVKAKAPAKVATAPIMPSVIVPKAAKAFAEVAPTKLPLIIKSPMSDLELEMVANNIANSKEDYSQAEYDRWLENQAAMTEQAQTAPEPTVTDSLRLSFGDIEASDTHVVLSTGTLDIVSAVENLYNSFDGISVPDDIAAKLVALQAGIGQKLDHMRTLENGEEVTLKAAEARQYDALVGDALNIASTLIEDLSTEVALDTAILIIEEATRGLSANGSMANTRQALRDNGDLAYYKTTQKMITDGDASNSRLVNRHSIAGDTRIANVIQQRQADTRMAAITSNHDAAMAAMGGENGRHYGFSVTGSAKAGFDNVNNSVAKGSALSIEITEGVILPKGYTPNPS